VILRGFGLKVGRVTGKSFEGRIRELVTGQAMLEQIAAAMLTTRASLQAQYAKLHKALLKIVRQDTVCRKMMSAPGVGPVVAMTYKSAIDDPHRIKKSKAVGPLLGLTPKKYQSGETNITGGISRAGDESVRTALYEAANVLLTRVTRFSALKRWGLQVAKRRGFKRAKVAVARKIAVMLHRMWIDGTVFRWSKAQQVECLETVTLTNLTNPISEATTINNAMKTNFRSRVDADSSELLSREPKSVRRGKR
jgi:transposase